MLEDLFLLLLLAALLTLFLTFKIKKLKKYKVIVGVMTIIFFVLFGFVNDDSEQKKGESSPVEYVEKLNKNKKIKSSIKSSDESNEKKKKPSKNTETDEPKKIVESVDRLKDRQKNTKTEGVYTVGTDMPAGEYVFVIGEEEISGSKDRYSGAYTITYFKDGEKESDGGTFYKEKSYFTDGLFSSADFTIEESNEYESDLLELSEGQIVELRNAKMYPAELRELVNESKIIEGMYKVGRDIPEGKYSFKEHNVSDETLHSVWIMRSIKPGLSPDDNWIASYQDYGENRYPEEIDLKSGTYIYFSDLILYKK